MIGDITRQLTCPVCHGQLTAIDRALHCPAGHSFDLARQGYVNLISGRAVHSGDTTAMV